LKNWQPVQFCWDSLPMGVCEDYKHNKKNENIGTMMMMMMMNY